MSSKKSELFHAHESDALRLIKRAQAGAEETEDKPSVDILKPPPEVFKKKKTGRPKKAEKDKSPRTKRFTLYLSPEEYDFFKEYAKNERFPMNDVIVNSAMMYLKKQMDEESAQEK